MKDKDLQITTSTQCKVTYSLFPRFFAMAKGERPLRRARCKQPPEKVGKSLSGKVAKVKKTSLAKATAAGLVPRAMKPFCSIAQYFHVGGGAYVKAPYLG